MSEAIIIGSDHAGFAAKEELKSYLLSKGMEVTDAGCYSEESVHYPCLLYTSAQRYCERASATDKGLARYKLGK